MTEQAKLALSESLEHWVRMRDGKQGPMEKPNGDSCALCRLHQDCVTQGHELIECYDEDGERCPIAAHTGKAEGCEGTPFFAARMEWQLTAFPAQAQRMIDFLREVQEADQ